MRLRSTIPAVTAGALLAAALSLPSAAADAAPGAPTPSTAAAAAAPSGDSASPSPSDSPTPTPSDTPAGAPAPADSQTPTPPPADSVTQLGNGLDDYWKTEAWILAPNAITSVTAHYVPVGSPAGTPDSATQDLVTDTVGGYLVYTSPSDVTLPALGVYDVSLDINEGDLGTEHIADAGTFTYAAKVTVGKLGEDRSTVDYDHRTVNLSAPVTVTDPSTGETLDPTGVQVGLDYSDDGYPAVTDGTVGADGQLAAAVQPGGSMTYQVGSANGSTAAYPYHLDSADPTGVAVTLVQDQSRVRITSGTNVYGVKGGTATLRGVVERKVGSAWTATPNETIDVVSQTGRCPSTTVKTGADGTFAFTSSCPDEYAFENFVHTDPYLQTVFPGPTGTINVPRPSSITSFTVTEDEYGMATVTGTVNSNDWATGAKGELVEIEFSYDNKTWHDAATFKVGDSNGDDEFQAYGTYATWANGYWRAKYLGSPDDQPSWSTSVKVYRTPTRVTGGKPNHTTVYKNQYVYFSGHVQQRSTKNVWGPLKYSWVDLVFRPYGSKTWYYVSHVKTSSTGAYSLHGEAFEGGTWSVAWWQHGGPQIDSNGPMTYVHVR